jgi:hypothetical protein
MRKNTSAGKWLLFWLAPSIPIKHLLFRFNIWMSGMAYWFQLRALKRAMKIIDSKEDMQNINQLLFLHLAISETQNKELKLSGFYAETPEQYQKEHDAVPGIKLIVMSLAALKENIIKNYMERRFYQYRADILARNGGHYVH